MSNVNLHPSIQDLAEDLKQQGKSGPITEDDLRDYAKLPSWCAVPPLVVELVNQHMGHGDVAYPKGDAAGADIPDLGDLLFGGLESIFGKKG